MKELSSILAALEAPNRGPAALATLVSVEGSSYRRPGARLLFTSEGKRIGSISGGCLEEDVLARAHRVLNTGVTECAVYDTTTENDLFWGVGLGCHGVVRVIIEPLKAKARWPQTLAANFAARRATSLAVVHQAPDPSLLGTFLETDITTPAGSELGVFRQKVLPPQALFVFGAGDDAQPLVRLAKEIGWHVTIADPRAAFATAARFPSADQRAIAPAADLVAHAGIEANAFAVVMTHHYVHDVPVIRELLQRPMAYVGLLGPKKRAEKILSDLRAEGLTFSPDQQQNLYSPTGLDLGADGPEQVALSIMAEMQAVLAGRDARPLRERQRSIHA